MALSGPWCFVDINAALRQYASRTTTTTGSGGGLGMQRVHGGSSLTEWYLGLQGQGLEEDVGGYFTTLGGKILDPKREVSGLGLCGLQEVVFHGRIRGGAARGTGKVEVPDIGEWQCTFCGAAHWNTRLSFSRCGTHRVGSLAVHGSFVGGQGRGNGVQPRSGGGGGFFGQGGVGSAMGGLRWFGPTGRDQTYVPQGEPTFRRGGGAQGRGRECGYSWCWCWWGPA